MAESINLTEVPEEDLLKEIERRKEERYHKALDRRSEHCQLMYTHLDAIINISQHTMRNCSDDNLNNEGVCTKCTLLGFKRDHFWDTEYVLDFSLHHRPIKKEDFL